MKIYNAQAQVVLDVAVDDNSYRYREIMGDDLVTLYFQLAEHVEIPTGSFIVYEGQTYTLEKPSNLVMRHTRLFEYTVTFESSRAKAKIWKFRHCVIHEVGGDGGDGRLKFDLVAKPHEHLQMFVDNMNMRDSGWRIGGCIEGAEKLISYDHAYCLEALQQMADTFETEFAIDGKVVYLRKLEYYKNAPLALSYGKGNGFVSGVGRTSEDEAPVEILFVQGGDKNIDPKSVESGGYGYKYLLLPKNRTLRYDGEKFEDEDGFNNDNARAYVTDAKGYSIRRADKELETMAEASLDCSSIYPKREGIVAQVITENEDEHLYDFTDDDPNIPNYRDYRIDGEQMSVIFQSGMLSGREFECNYIHNAVGNKLPHRFELKPEEKDGITMPDASQGFVPVPGDKYVVFHCRLPQEYIDAAELEMLKEGVRHKYDREEARFSFTGTLDAIWAKRDWRNISAKIVLGGFVLFSDTRFQPEGLNIRITGIKDYINNPHAPELTLSNEVVSPGFSASIRQIESQEVHVETLHQDALQFTKRKFRDAKETMEALSAELPALQENLMQYFTENIAPIAVQTMQLLVGDESLQFCFVNDGFQRVSDGIIYDGGHMHCEERIIQHLTLGVDTNITTGRGDKDYYFFMMNAFESGPLPDGVCYLYAKVNINDRGLEGMGNGEYNISQSIKSFEESPGNVYNLLIGIIGSAQDGERSWMPLYGFTEIAGGRITTDRIVSADGNTYFDLSIGEIGGIIKFLAGGSSHSLSNFYTGTVESIDGLEDGVLENAEAIQALRTAANNLEFLLATFGDGHTIIAGGTVISGFMGVCDTANEVVAAISGKDYLNIGNSPMIYAGASGGDVQLFAWEDNTPNGPVDMNGLRIAVYTMKLHPDVGDWLYNAYGVVLGTITVVSTTAINAFQSSYTRKSSRDTQCTLSALRNSDNARFRVYQDGTCAAKYFRVEGTMITPYMRLYFDDDRDNNFENVVCPSDVSLSYLIQQNDGLSNVVIEKHGYVDNDFAQHTVVAPLVFGRMFIQGNDDTQIRPYIPLVMPDGYTLHVHAIVSPTSYNDGTNTSTNYVIISVFLGYHYENGEYFLNYRHFRIPNGGSITLCYLAGIGWTLQDKCGDVVVNEDF